MKFSKYIIALIFIVMILSVGAVSATEDIISTDDAGNSLLSADNSDSSVLSADNAGVVKYYVNSSIAISGDGSQSSPFKTIGEAINNINTVNGTEIHLADGVYSSVGDKNFNSLYSIGNLSILGSGENTIIDLSQNGYFMNAYDYDANLVIKDLTITNGFGSYNSIFTNMGSLTLENVNIYNSRSNNQWGDSYIIRNAGEANIINCKFINNTARSGNVYVGGKVHVTDSTFINNVITSYTDGGALSCTGGEVINCVFNDNRAGDDRSGGAIYTSRDLNVTNCNFTNNMAPRYGGAISGASNKKLNVVNSTFTLNKANNNGGAINLPANVENCKFYNNTASQDGGAIYIQNGNIENNIFIGNTAYRTGAAIYAQGAPSLKNNTAENCKSQKDDFVYFSSLSTLKGITYVVLDNSSFTIESVNVRLNASLFDGDGNPISGYTVTFLMNDEVVGTADSMFGTASLSFNKILNGTYVVSVKLPNDDCEVKTATLTISPLENIDVYISPEGDDEKGDGSENNPYKTVDKGLIEASKAINGNLYVKNGMYNVTKSYDIDSMGNFSIIAYGGNATFDMGNNNCFATVKGNVSIYNVTFINGYSTSTSTLKSLFSGESLKLVGCSFINNTCYQYLLGVSYVDIESCYFTNNTVKAVIYGRGGTIRNSFIDDKKGTGNTIYASALNDLIIDNSVFDSVYFNIYSDISTKITNSKFYNNKVNYNVIQTGGKIVVDNCTFVNQTQNSIRINDKNANITNCKFINNSGTLANSAIYYNTNNAERSLYLGNNTVINSTSSYYVYSQGYISSPYTFVVLNNETIDIEAFGFKFTAIGYDDVSNKINFAGGNFLLNGTSIGSASSDNDGVYLNYKQMLDGNYTVSFKSAYIDDAFIKTATLKITPANNELWVSVDGDDENNGSEAYPFKTLDKAISEANGFNNIIHMADGNYNIQGPFAISTYEGTLTIVGSDNTVIDLNKSSRFINSISSDSIVLLKDLSIVNGYVTAVGGSIVNAGNLTVNHVSFINSTSYGTRATIRGGAIYNTGTLYVINSSFVNCTARQGGAIYNTNYLYLENNTVENVVATSGTGNYVLTTGIVDGVTLEFNNNATYDLTDSNVILTVTVSDNGNLITGSGTNANILITFLLNGNNVGTAYLGDGIASVSVNKKFDGKYTLSGNLGGAENQNIKTATFNYNIPGLLNEAWVSENGSDESGDGSQENPFATIDKALTMVYDAGSTIHVLKGNYVFTKKIAISSYITIIGEEEGVIFDGSMSQFFNIEKSSSLTIKNVTFTNAKSNQMIDNRGSLTVDNCIFENNTGSSYQFLIYSMEGELNLFNSIFRNNTVTISGSSSGVLIWQNGEAKIANTTFSNNTANTQSTLIYLQNGQYYDASWRSYWTNYGALIENSKFEDNLGSILSLDYIDVPITDSVFSNNTGRYVIYLGGSNNAIKRVLNISNSNFTDNDVSEGIIELQNYVADIQNNIFANNTGCIGFSTGYNNHEFIIANNTISNNSANDYGNYLYINNYATISGSTLKFIFNDNASYVVESFEVPLNVTLVDEDGNQINGIYVTFSLNGTNAGQVRIVDGVAEVSKLVAANGNYTVSGSPQIANTNKYEILTAVFEVKLEENKVIYVDVFGNDTTGDGSEDNPYASLSRAFKDINAINTTIYIKPGVYSGELNYDNELTIPGGAYVEIVGLSEFGDNVIFKDLSNRFLGFNVQGVGSINDAVNFAVKNIIFEDSTFDNGFITGNNYVCVLIDNITFVNATPRQLAVGGNFGFNLIVSNVDIDFNNATFTDSVPFMSSTPPRGNGGSFKLINSSFKNGNFENSEYFIYAGSIEIINSTFANISMRMSRSSYLIYSYFGLNIDNSTFINNSAVTIIDKANRDGYINNSVFDSNRVSGGFFITNTGGLAISNCVIYNTTGNGYLFGRGGSAVNDPINNWYGYNNFTSNPNIRLNMVVNSWVIANVNASDVFVDEEATFDIFFTSNDGSELNDTIPTRIVELTFANETQTYELTNNKVTVTYTPNSTGNITIKVDNQTFTFEVGKATPVVSGESEIDYNIDLDYNASIIACNKSISNMTFTITVGDVVFANVTSDENGNVILDLSGFKAGEYNVTYDVPETYKYTATSGNYTLTINKANPEISIDSVTDDTIEIAVPEDITGNLTATIDSEEYEVLVNNGTATVNVSDLKPGKYTAVITYSGDDNYDDSVIVESIVIPKEEVTPEITVCDDTVSVELPEDATGYVLVDVNGTTFWAPVEDGAAEITLDGLDAGNYTATVIYTGDETYAPANKTVDVEIPEVIPEDAGLKVTVDDAVITVSLNENATGYVVVTVDDNDLFFEFNGEDIVVDLSDLASGNYTVDVSYSGDDIFAGANDTVNVEIPEVIPEDAGLKVTVDDAVVTVSLNENATGYVVVTVDDKEYYFDADEEIELDLSDLASGNYTVDVSYSGDDIFAGANDTVNVEIPEIVPEDPELKLTVENTTITATINKDATGLLIVTVGDISYVYDATDAPIVLNVANFDAGTYDVFVLYVGDDVFAAANATSSVTVPSDKNDTPIDPKADINISDDGIDVVLPSDAKGYVLVTVDDTVYYVPVEKGKASFELPELASGNHTVEVAYSGDDTYAPAKANSTIEIPEVIPEDANITVDVNDTEVSVELPEDATGYVVVSVGGKDYFFDAGNDITLDLSDLAPGEYLVEIAYSGDDKYAPATTNATVTVPEVVPEDANVTVDVNDSDVAVELPEDATGYVVVSVGGKKYYFDADDEITLDLSDLAPGEYPVEITYSGDDKYAPATANATVTVPEVVPEDANLTADAQNTTITVKLAENATGNVLVDVNGTGYYAPIENGQVTVEVIGLDEGEYQATVTYSGDDTYAPANVTVAVTVSPAPKNDTPVDPEANVTASEDAIEIELPEDATGYMLVDVDGTGYYVPVENGTAIFELPELAPGNHTVGVTYTGDKKYAPANSTETIEVPLPDETIFADDLVKVDKAADRFVANFTDSEGNPLANANITFNINGQDYTRVTDANGQASIAINLSPGNYTITTTNPVTGDSKVNNITVLSRFTEDGDLVKHYRNDSQYVLRVLGDDTNPVGAGEIVTYNINGVFYNRTTNASGHVKLNINLAPGTYIITAEYKGAKVAHNVTVLPILTAEDLTKKFGEAGAFEAHVYDAQGKPAANQEVQFNINGVLYYRTSGSDGIAKLNINLGPGEYIITSAYGGATIGNTVTVTA